MTSAFKSNVMSSIGGGEEPLLRPSGMLAELVRADRQALSDWLDGADGIDTIMDLTGRPWNIDSADAVFGVFESAKKQASWIVVRYDLVWTLARCADGLVSDVMVSLPEIFRLIDEQRKYGRSSRGH